MESTVAHTMCECKVTGHRKQIKLKVSLLYQKKGWVQLIWRVRDIYYLSVLYKKVIRLSKLIQAFI